MNEKLEVEKDSGIEEFRRKEYEDFRKEILEFKNLPESTFTNDRNNIGPISAEESKKLHAYGISTRINNSACTPEQKIELQKFWEKEMLGIERQFDK